MLELTDIGTIKALLARHGFHFSKALGQNFIVNPSVCPRMADESGIDSESGVIEIGAGIGVLTAELAKRAKKVDPALGYVGEITAVNVKPVLDVIEKGYIPVVSTIGCDSDGNVYNINADTAAAKIAGELGAASLISMTDICGILKDKDDPATLIPKITISHAPELIEQGIISGGMIPKVECCINAVKWGVQRVFIIDGRIPHAILIEMLTDEGIGTMFIDE